MISTLVLIYLGRTRHDYTIRAKFIKFQIVDPEICSILIFLKGLELASRPHFSEKYFCYILLTDLHCLVASTSGDIGQHMYCNYLLSNL